MRRTTDGRLVGVADLRISGTLTLFDQDGRHAISEYILDRDMTAGDRGGLTEMAAAIVTNEPRLCGLMIIVGTANQRQLHLERIDIDPIPVFSIPATMAAAYGVPDLWSSFQLIDYDSETWWLIDKKAKEVFAVGAAQFSQLIGSTGEIMGQFEAMGFVRVATLGGSDQIPNALVVDTNVLAAGAHQVWRRRVHTEGVHLSLDHGGRAMLQVDTGLRIRYRILHVDQPAFAVEEDAIAEFIGQRPALIAIDEKVNAIYGEQIAIYGRERLNCAGTVLISGREDRKTWRQVDWICREAARLKLPRHGVMIAVGGGVVLDVIGFAASVYRRGIGYLRVPTSLIGMIDAGLGIKQGVNFIQKKNLLGAFYPPIGTVNDPSFLKTLSIRDMSCGIAEVIKIALVRSHRAFELLEEHGEELVESRFTRPALTASHLLRLAQFLMLDELQPNLYETNLARVVDFGHTFSPVIEAQSRFMIPHGHAVALDMLLSTAIAIDRGLCTEELFYRITKLYEQVLLPVDSVDCSADELTLALDAARLHRGGNLNLVVLTNLGQPVFLQDVERDDIARAIARLHCISRGSLRVAHVGAGI
jgi:3-dehydroquinate synthase